MFTHSVMVGALSDVNAYDDWTEKARFLARNGKYD
jgi:hypothetical protein